MNETDCRNLFKDKPALEKIEKLLQGIQKMQTVMAVLQHDMQDEGGRKLRLTKIGTVLTLAILRKFQDGTQPGSFTKEDWADIANTVADYAVLMDGRTYSEFVFTLYGRYINASADFIEDNLSAADVAAIRQIPIEITAKTEQLHAEEISEPAYVEDCLWLCLEGLVKLLSAYISYRIGEALGPEFAQLTESLASFAFEYARLCTYQREQALLQEYIQNQYRLDAELEAKYEKYLRDLQNQAEKFNTLVDRAFSSDFRTALHNSAELAKQFGVPQEEILRSIQDVDDFFLD